MFGRIEIRRFRLADLDRIMEIEHASFGKDAYERNLFAEFYHKCGDLFLVAERRSRRKQLFAQIVDVEGQLANLQGVRSTPKRLDC